MITIHLKNPQPYALPRYQADHKRPDTGEHCELKTGESGIYAPELTVNLFDHRMVVKGEALSHELAVDAFLSLLAQTKPFIASTYLPYPAVDGENSGCLHVHSQTFREAKSFCNQPWLVSKGLDGTPDLIVSMDHDTVVLEGLISQTLPITAFVHPSREWNDQQTYIQPLNTVEFPYLTSACFAAGTAFGWHQIDPITFDVTPFDFENLKSVFLTSYDMLPLFHSETRKTTDFSRRHKLKSRHNSAGKRREASEDMFFPVALSLLKAGWALNRGWGPTGWVVNIPFWTRIFEDEKAQRWFQLGQDFGALGQHKNVDVARFLQANT